MTKEQLILLLKKYKENKSNLKVKTKRLYELRLELKDLKEINISVTSKYALNSDIHSKNQVNDTVGNNVARRQDKKTELEEKIKQLEGEVKELKDKIEVIDDRLEALTEKEELLLSSYFFEEHSYSYIGNKIYLEKYNETRSEDAIKRMIEKALNKMEKISA